MYLFFPEVALVESQSMPRSSVPHQANLHEVLGLNIYFWREKQIVLWNVLKLENANVEIQKKIKYNAFIRLLKLYNILSHNLFVILSCGEFTTL